jgi:PAS domain S-box-containing protein
MTDSHSSPAHGSSPTEINHLLKRLAEAEIRELEHTVAAENQRKLMEFIGRVMSRLDDDQLMDVIVEEFLLELGADRLSYVIGDSTAGSVWTVAFEAVDAGISRLPLPYFISPEADQDFSLIFRKSQKKKGEPLLSQWEVPAVIRPESPFGGDMADDFHSALQETFGLARTVECRKAMVCSLENSQSEGALICVQKVREGAEFTTAQISLFREMCRYAGSLIEQTQLLENVRELKDQMDSLVESMPSGIVSIDLLGTVLAWNGKAQEFFGISSKDALGKVFWKLAPSFEFIEDGIRVLLQDGGEGVREFDALRLDGESVRYVKPSLFSLFGRDRGEIGIRLDDVTRTMELRSQLFQSQRQEIVGALAQGMAREFRDVLASLRGGVTLLERDIGDLLGPQTKVQEDMGILRDCAERAHGILNQLLALGGEENVHHERFNAAETLRKIAGLSRAVMGRNIHLREKIAEGEFWIQGVPFRLEQAVWNLLVNAKQAMPEGGRIILGLEVEDLISDRPAIRMMVQDTGEGIAPEDLPKIFDPFFSTKGGMGSGLGLSVVEAAVQLHGGRVEVKSKVGEGTSFILHLPLNTQAVEPKTASIPEMPLGQGRVALVQSDSELKRTLSRMLEELGYQVKTFGDGASLVAWLDQGEAIQLIALDFDLPVMNGLDTWGIVSRLRPELPGLLIGSPEGNSGWIPPQGLGLLPKPFGMEDLAQVVQSKLRGETP